MTPLTQFLKEAEARMQRVKEAREKAPHCEAYVPEYDAAVCPRLRCVSVEVALDFRLQIVPDCNKDLRLAEFIALAANETPSLAADFERMAQVLKVMQDALKRIFDAAEETGHRCYFSKLAREARAEVERILKS